MEKYTEAHKLEVTFDEDDVCSLGSVGSGRSRRSAGTAGSKLKPQVRRVCEDQGFEYQYDDHESVASEMSSVKERLSRLEQKEENYHKSRATCGSFRCKLSRKALLLLALFVIPVLVAVGAIVGISQKRQKASKLNQNTEECVAFTVDEVKETRIILELDGLTDDIDGDQRQVVSDALIVAYNNVSAGCDDKYKRWMISSNVFEQLINITLNSSRVEIDAEISCQDCPDEEIFASDYSSVFADDTDDGNGGRRRTRNLIINSNFQSPRRSIPKIKGNSRNLMMNGVEPRELNDEDFTAHEIIVAMEDILLNDQEEGQFSDTFDGISEATIQSRNGDLSFSVRNGKGKSKGLSKGSSKGKSKGSSTDGGEEFCFAVGRRFEISGTDDPEDTGRTDGGDLFGAGLMENTSDECQEELIEVSTTCNDPPTGQSDAYEDALEDYQECREDAGYFDFPWWYNRDVYGQFQFQSVDDGAPDNGGGDGSYRGIVLDNKAAPDGIPDPNGGYAVKAELEYWLPEMRDSDPAKLSGISFDYYIESCATDDACSGCASCATATAGTPPGSSCVNQIYVNLYFRSEASRESFYDCNLFYLAGTFGSGSTTGVWHSFSFSATDTANGNFERGTVGTDPRCDRNGAISELSSIVDAAENNYVLGTKGAVCGDSAFTFKISVGDSNCQDSGMIVYLDNIRVTYDFDDGSSVHDYNMVA